MPPRRRRRFDPTQLAQNPRWHKREPTWRGVYGEKYIRAQPGDMDPDDAQSLLSVYGPTASLWLVVARRTTDDPSWPELPIAGYSEVVLNRRGVTASARLVHLYPIRRAKKAIAVLTDITLNAM